MALIKRSFLAKRPQELGRIKIGGLGKKITSKKGNEFQPPKKYDHFVVTTMRRGEDGNFLRDEEIHAKIGEKPTELAGILMFETPEENFHSEMALYRGRGKDGKVLSCDGETCTVMSSGKQGPCPRAQGKDSCAKLGGKEHACKPYGRLHIQLWNSPHTLGYHVFRTTSWESVNNIQSALEEIHARFGTCYNAPVKLVAYPSEDSHDGGTSTSLKVGLVLAMGMAEAAAKIAESRQYLEIAKGNTKLLSAAVQEDQTARDAEEAELIGKEFYPPSSAEIVHEAVALDDDPDPEPEEDDPDTEHEPEAEEEPAGALGEDL